MTARLYLLAFVAIAVVVACERVPLTSPTGSTISVTVTQSTMPLSGQATVRATVIESGGTPVHNGTQVTFESNLGSFDPPQVATSGGVATTTFLSGLISGTAKINAFSGGASTGSGNSSGGAEVKIGAAAASGNISVSATPPTISQSGGAVTISAIVFDAASNPLPGVNVQFAATTGSLSLTTANTDANGIARTLLTTTSTSTVTARAGTAVGEVTITASAAPTITITAPDTGIVGNPVAITVAVTGGTTATPRQVQTLVINYGDGTSDSRTNVTGSVGFTHTYSRSGGYSIGVTATDVSGNTGIASDSIVITDQSLPTVTLTAAPNPVSSAPPTNGVVTFTVTATSGTSGGTPIRNVRVTLGDGTVIYNGTGSGTFAYKFPTATAITTYTVTATATEASGATATTSTTVVVTP